MADTARTLLIVRTPLQSLIAGKVVEEAGLDPFDLVTITQHDSPEDRTYHARLASRARQSAYVSVPVYRPDLRNHVAMRRGLPRFALDGQYDTVAAASIDTFVIGALVARHARARLVTFDDGLGNVLPGSRYWAENTTRRHRLYRRLFGTPGIEALHRRIETHYTIFPGTPNMIGAERIRPLRIVEQSEGGDATLPPRRYFIGQPFAESLSPPQIARLRERMVAHRPDVYVRHPREAAPLDLGAPFLDKKGRLAEEAIVEDAAGAPIVLLGWLSATMANLAGSCREVRAFLPDDHPEFADHARLAESLGMIVES